MSRFESEVVEFAPGVYSVPTDYPSIADAPLWIYIVRDTETMMCDAACATTYDAALRPAFAEIGMDADDLDWALITHGHPDHTGAVKSLRAAGSHCRVAAPLQDATWVENFDRQWKEFWQAFPGVVDVSAHYDSMRSMSSGDLPVDLLLRDGDHLDLGRHSFLAVRTHGHTPGHMAYFDETSGVLLTGDVGVGRTIATISGTSRFPPLYVDVDDHLESLARLRSLPFEWLCPAHVAPVPRDRGLELIDQAIAFVDEIDEVVLGAVADADGSVSLRQIVSVLGEYVGMNPPVWVHTAYLARAHLNRAAGNGLVESRWRATPHGGGTNA